MTPEVDAQLLLFAGVLAAIGLVLIFTAPGGRKR